MKSQEHELSRVPHGSSAPSQGSAWQAWRLELSSLSTRFVHVLNASLLGLLQHKGEILQIQEILVCGWPARTASAQEGPSPRFGSRCRLTAALWRCRTQARDEMFDRLSFPQLVRTGGKS